MVYIVGILALIIYYITLFYTIKSFYIRGMDDCHEEKIEIIDQKQNKLFGINLKD